MKREIKFRTWDTEKQEFSEWTNRDPFFSTSHGQIFFWERTRKEDGSYGGDIILQDLSDRFILQQYTGLRDKNGVEIYEGDVVSIWQSGWNCGGMGDKMVQETVEFKNGGFTNCFHVTGRIEVIGNIFERG